MDTNKPSSSDRSSQGPHVSSDRMEAVAAYKAPEAPEASAAPWKEIYKDVNVLETAHGCVVKVGNALTFVPGATVLSFPRNR